MFPNFWRFNIFPLLLERAKTRFDYHGQYMWCDWFTNVGRLCACVSVCVCECVLFSWLSVLWLQKICLILSFSASCSAWHRGYGSGGSVWFQVTRSCVGGLVLVVVGLPAYRKCPPPITRTPSPCKSCLCFLLAHNEMHLQGCLFTSLWNTSLCINRAPIHSIGGLVFTNMSANGDVDIRSKLRVKFMAIGILTNQIPVCIPTDTNPTELQITTWCNTFVLTLTLN